MTLACNYYCAWANGCRTSSGPSLRRSCPPSTRARSHPSPHVRTYVRAPARKRRHLGASARFRYPSAHAHVSLVPRPSRAPTPRHWRKSLRVGSWNDSNLFNYLFYTDPARIDLWEPAGDSTHLVHCKERPIGCIALQYRSVYNRLKLGCGSRIMYSRGSTVSVFIRLQTVLALSLAWA